MKLRFNVFGRTRAEIEERARERVTVLCGEPPAPSALDKAITATWLPPVEKWQALVELDISERR